MSHSRPLAFLSLAALSALVLSGCATETVAAVDTSGAETESVSFSWDRNIAAEDAEAEYEATTVEVPKNPQNVVVFDMASLDTIGALGGEIAGAPLDSVPDYLEGYLADDAFNSGTLFEADLIAIEAQQPDLIIIGGRSSALYGDLSEIAPTVDLSIAGSFIETLERNTTFLGEVFDAEDEAAEALADLEKGIEQARAATAEAGSGLALMVSGGKLSAQAPAGDDATGRNARGGLIYDVFGVVPAIEDIKSATHGEPISFEFLLEHNSDYLWVVDRDAATSTEDAQPAAVILDNEIVKQTTAFQNEQIVYLNPTAWYIVFGGLDTTRIMIDDVLQIAE